MLGVTGFMAVAGAVFIAVRYRLLGVRSVEVTPEAVVVERFGRSAIRIGRDELTEAWIDAKWRIAGGGQRVTVREYGFADDEWLDLSFALRAWQDAGPVETLPGVLAGPAEISEAPEVVVYEPKHNPALWWWGPAFYALLATVPLLAMLVSLLVNRDLNWWEHPLLFVSAFCLLVGGGFFTLFLFGLPRIVRRATFLPEHLVVERYVGEPRIVPYGAILDLHRNHLVTEQGRFMFGERNAGAFHRLLDPHLEDGQVSGEADLRNYLEARNALYGLGAGFVLGFLAASVWPGGLGWFWLCFFGSFGAAWLIARIQTRRELNRIADL
ncbi:MAG: hypothetical protein AAGI91_16405 [Bacteroidota bacterium]